MKRLYVAAVHGLRSVLRAVGLLAVLDAWASRSRTGSWVRSLLAIYDMQELIAIDTPWWTYESAQLVEHHLAQRPGAAVLEWGSGASTVWLARRAGRVTAIEHDPRWAASVREALEDAAEVLTVEPETAGRGAVTPSAKRGFEGLDFTNYVSAASGVDGPFDLVVIDGRAREACLLAALPHLADGGLIVFDNVDRERYRDAIRAVPGIDVQITRGLTPALPYPTRTALIRRSATG